MSKSSLVDLLCSWKSHLHGEFNLHSGFKEHPGGEGDLGPTLLKFIVIRISQMDLDDSN